jgi:hypothetical protein
MSSGETDLRTTLSLLVMAGLDPAIQTRRQTAVFLKGWMAASMAVMTSWVERQIRELALEMCGRVSKTCPILIM